MLLTINGERMAFLTTNHVNTWISFQNSRSILQTIMYKYSNMMDKSGDQDKDNSYKLWE